MSIQADSRRAVLFLSAVIMAVGIFVSTVPTTAFAQSSSCAQSVRGYTKKNGTYVAPYYRSYPDNTVTNNWSYKGNINPYTGQVGTRSYSPSSLYLAPPALPASTAPAKMESLFKPVAADLSIVWSFNENTQSWVKYDPNAPAFASTLRELAPYQVVLIVAAKDIKGFVLGSRTLDLVQGNNYKPYIP